MKQKLLFSRAFMVVHVCLSLIGVVGVVQAQQIVSYNVPQSQPLSVYVPLSSDLPATTTDTYTNQGQLVSSATCNGFYDGDYYVTTGYQWNYSGVGQNEYFSNGTATLFYYTTTYTCNCPTGTCPPYKFQNSGTSAPASTTKYASINALTPVSILSLASAVCGSSVINLESSAYSTGTYSGTGFNTNFTINGGGVSATSQSMAAYDGANVTVASSTVYKNSSGTTTLATVNSSKVWSIGQAASDAGGIYGTTQYCPGASASLAVNTCSGCSYAWHENGGGLVGSYGGATSNNLTWSTNASQNGHVYSVTITDGCGNQSNPSGVTLTFYGQVPTSTISLSPGSSVCPGSTLTLSGSATPQDGSTISYHWQMFDGQNWNDLSDGTTSDGTISGSSSTSTASMQLTPSVGSQWSGKQFRFRAWDACSSGAPNGTNEGTSAGVQLTVYNPVTISSSDVSAATVCQNGSLNGQLAVSVTSSQNDGALTYQWQMSPTGVAGSYSAVSNNASGGNQISGQGTNALNLGNIQPSWDGYYVRCQVWDGCGQAAAATSTATKLTVYAQIAGVSNPVSNSAICPSPGSDVQFVTSISGGTQPNFDWQVNNGSGWADVTSLANYTNIYSISSSSTGSTLSVLKSAITSAAMNGYKYQCIISSGVSCGVAVTTTPAAILNINTPVSKPTTPVFSTSVCAGSGTYTVSSTATGNPAPTVTGWNDNGAPITASAGVYSNWTTSSLTFTSPSAALNGHVYTCTYSNVCGSNTSAPVTLNLAAPPTINSPYPASETICQGTTFTATVSANGGGVLSYQWQKGGVNFGSPSSSPTLTINNVTQAANGGSYSVIVSNGCTPNANTVGSPAVLTVNPATTVSNPASQGVCLGGNASFTVSGSGTGSISYQWQESQDGGMTFVDVGSNSNTYAINNVTAAMSGFQVKVVAHSATCSPDATSGVGTLTVNPIPSAPVVNASVAASPDTVSICTSGTGVSLSATVSSTAPSPTFNWYDNLGNVVQAHTVANSQTYNIAVLSSNTTLYATTVSQGCESAKQAVVYNLIKYNAPNIGSALTLCSKQGQYNLGGDISSPNATGGVFSGTGVVYTNYAYYFDPSVGAGNYSVTYIPIASGKGIPYCYTNTTRNVTVSSTGGSINFSGPAVHSNNINSCVGDIINLSSLVDPSLAGGTWSGSGVTVTGSGAIFTAASSLITTVNANVAQYNVTSGGCTLSGNLDIYVTQNTSPPVVTGLPSVICPGANLTLTANVTAQGTFTYRWFHSGQSVPFDTVASIPFNVTKDTTLFVSSVQYGCASQQTAVDIVTPFKGGTIQPSQISIPIGGFIDFVFSGSGTNNSFSWNFGDGNGSVEQSPVHYYYDSGTYVVSLHITSSLGCSEDLSYSPIKVSGAPYSVVTADKPNVVNGNTDVSLYPNPIAVNANLMSTKGMSGFRILSLSGVELMSGTLNNVGRAEINCGNLTSGMYFIDVVAGSKHYVFKIVKQ